MEWLELLHLHALQLGRVHAHAAPKTNEREKKSRLIKFRLQSGAPCGAGGHLVENNCNGDPHLAHGFARVNSLPTKAIVSCAGEEGMVGGQHEAGSQGRVETTP